MNGGDSGTRRHGRRDGRRILSTVLAVGALRHLLRRPVQLVGRRRRVRRGELRQPGQPDARLRGRPGRDRRAVHRGPRPERTVPARRLPCPPAPRRRRPDQDDGVQAGVPPGAAGGAPVAVHRRRQRPARQPEPVPRGAGRQPPALQPRRGRQHPDRARPVPRGPRRQHPRHGAVAPAEEFQQLSVGAARRVAHARRSLVIALDRDPRRGVFKVGVALAAAGFLLVGLAVLAPRIAAAYVSDPGVSPGPPVGHHDLRRGPPGARPLGHRLRRRRRRPRHRLGAAPRADRRPDRVERHPRPPLRVDPDHHGGPGLAGRADHRRRRGARPRARRGCCRWPWRWSAPTSSTSAWCSSSRSWAAPRPAPALRHGGPNPERRRHLLWVVAGGATILVLLTAVGVGATVAARRHVGGGGRTPLQRLGRPVRPPHRRVAFPATTTRCRRRASRAGCSPSRAPASPPSSTTDPGPPGEDPLRHPHRVALTGADLVVTDRAAELAVNPRRSSRPSTEAQAGAAERATQLAASAGSIPPAATSTCATSTASTAPRPCAGARRRQAVPRPEPRRGHHLVHRRLRVRRRHREVFQEVGLFDRLYPYDGSQPPPTLGQLIDARQNIFLLSEFTGHPPAWNNPGYGLFQDTPFTFTDAEPAHRRGRRRLGALGHHLRHRSGRRHGGLPGHGASHRHHARRSAPTGPASPAAARTGALRTRRSSRSTTG